MIDEPETAEQINQRAALKVAVAALDTIANQADHPTGSEGESNSQYCPECIAERARQTVAALMGV